MKCLVCNKESKGKAMCCEDFWVLRTMDDDPTEPWRAPTGSSQAYHVDPPSKEIARLMRIESVARLILTHMDVNRYTTQHTEMLREVLR